MSASSVDPQTRVSERITSFRAPLRSAVFWLSFAGLGCVWSGFLLWARGGAWVDRVGAGLGIALSLLGLSLWSVWQGRVWRDPRRALRKVLRSVDEEGAARVVRAHGLWESSRGSEQAPGATSAELATLHFHRSLDAFPKELLERAGRARARLGARGAWALLLLWAALIVFQGWSLLEGALVLGARSGKGLLSLPYVAEVETRVELPAYLREGERWFFLGESSSLIPQGSTVLVRIVPRIEGRSLVLTDGIHEEPFVSEGAGTWVARLPLEQSADFRIAARQGEVLLFDFFERHIEAVSDQPPRVLLEDAPREIALAELERLELNFLAMDDHGLSELNLVVRSGRQEQRTELARLDGKQTTYRGAHALTRSHPWIARAFLPVRVTIEARDADAVTGPKWGSSEIITLLPPPLGFQAASRHRLLREFRGELVRVLSDDLSAAGFSLTGAREAQRVSRAGLVTFFERTKSSLLELAEPPLGSLRFLQAQVELLNREPHSTSTLEAVLLAVDVLLGDLSRSEAKRTGEELAGALEELALLARSLREDPERAVGHDALKELIFLAEQGAKQLEELGSLGLDLGSVARADLGRAERALTEKSYDRLERIALHLAQRLRHGAPSFGARGAGGVESGAPSRGGGGSGEGSSGEPTSDAPGEYDGLSQRAARLAQDHAKELSELDRLLDEAKRAVQTDLGKDAQWREEAKELRGALSGLPRVGSSPGSAASEASLGRNQGEAMADALESGDLERALERGRDALGALERSAQLLERQGSSVSRSALSRAQDQLKKSLDRAERAQKDKASSLEERVGSELRDRAAKERALAEETERLGREGSGKSAPLPRESLDALDRASRKMREAARSLESGRGEEGRRLAEEAQRELERAQPGQSSGESSQEESESGRAGDGRRPKSEGEVPEEDKRERARSFRERVQRGLARKSGSLSQAIERYAEGLQ